MTDTLRAVSGARLGEDAWLNLEELAHAVDAEVDFVRALADEGLLQPPVQQPQWRFGGEELARVRRIRRLQRDFEASLQSVAVMLDLLDEIGRLRATLRRAGLPG